MCQKCIDKGLKPNVVQGVIAVDDENNIFALQMVDGEAVNGIFLGPLNMEVISQFQETVNKLRQVVMAEIAPVSKSLQ